MGLKKSVMAEMFHDMGLDPTHAHTIKDVGKDGHMQVPIPSHGLRRGEAVHPHPVRAALVELPPKEEPKVEPVAKVEEPVAEVAPAVEPVADGEVDVTQSKKKSSKK